MKRLYLECKMGASGNMLTGALLELLPDPQVFLPRFAALQLPHIALTYEKTARCGITGTLSEVMIDGKEETDHHHHSGEDHHHHHHTLPQLLTIIESLPCSHRVRNDASAIYRLLAQAESQVHGQPMDQIHFHEVGSLDALADIVAVCMLMELLAPDQILASPIHVGNGTVHCAHGILPVPAPATAVLLQGIPFYTGDIDTELCTPTGAAILRYYAASFGPQPVMAVSRIGIGFGRKELPQANCLRAFWSEEPSEPSEDICELSCNLDDMTPEALSYARAQLEQAGALDVAMLPMQMKKNRPGILLLCLCRPQETDTFIKLLLTHTTTAGVRYHRVHRTAMAVSFRDVETIYGTVREKHYKGGGIEKCKPEYADLSRCATDHGVPLEQVRADWQIARSMPFNGSAAGD